ncbi:MAG: IS3 family transposase, partial [Candidatus Phytoplasma pyri]
QLNLLCQTPKNTVPVKKTLRFYSKTPTAIKPNLLNLNFSATKPYQKLVTDITYLPRNLYLSAIMDLYNREIVAFKIASQPDLKLVMNTVNQLPPLTTPCILHADQGSQYTSIKFITFLKQRNLQPSFSPKASPIHNSPLESFWGNLKSETFQMSSGSLSQTEIITIITNFIQYYNQSRPHQYLNYYPPQIFKLQNGVQN